MKRSRHAQDPFSSEDLEVASDGEGPSAAASGLPSPTRARRGGRELAEARGQGYASRSGANAGGAAPAAVRESKKVAAPLAPADKMGGLPLPDVVRELLKEKNILRWDAKEGVYEVLHGDNFERRFNELRKVRSKVKAAGTERPFSRMYNFYLLEKGDKWARTGTKFRPRSAASQPTPEILAAVRALEVKRPLQALVMGSASRASPSSRQSLSGTSSAASSPRVAPAPQKLPSPTAASLAHTAAPRPEGDHQRRSRDASFRIESQVPSVAHVRAPPSAPRHQPCMPPSASRGMEVRTLGKRGYTALLDDEAAESPREVLERGTLSEHIARAFREASHHHPSLHHSPRFSSAAPAGAQRRPGDDAALVSHFQEFHDYSVSRYPAAAEAHHGHRQHHEASISEPIEIDDASSGFPSPECMLALGGEFSGSPLDLGDPELSLFGTEADEHHMATGGTSSKDHSLLLDPFEGDEAWTSLHNVMW